MKKVIKNHVEIRGRWNWEISGRCFKYSFDIFILNCIRMFKTMQSIHMQISKKILLLYTVLNKFTSSNKQSGQRKPTFFIQVHNRFKQFSKITTVSGVKQISFNKKIQKVYLIVHCDATNWDFTNFYPRFKKIWIFVPEEWKLVSTNQI